MADHKKIERRNHVLRQIIGELYNLVYLPTFNKANGVKNIFPNGRNPSITTGYEIKVSAMAAQDAISGTSTGKKTLQDFAYKMVEDGLEVDGSTVTLDEVADL